MCEFFSFTSDGKGNILFFDWELRKKCLSGEIKANPDSHTDIDSHFCRKENRNKYKYNPLTKVLTVNAINTTDDINLVSAKAMALSFKQIVEPLIIKPLTRPLLLKGKSAITDEAAAKLQKFAVVRAAIQSAVGVSVWDPVGASVWATTGEFVGASVRNSVWATIRDSAINLPETFTENFVWDFAAAYISSFFSIGQWKYIEHEPFKNPFQCAIDLWELLYCGNNS